MRNVPPEVVVTEALDALLADLNATLADLRRPAELIEAEQRVIDARERRAELWQAYRTAVNVLGSSLSRDAASEAQVHRTKAHLDKADREVERVQKALSSHRERHGRTIAAAVERHRAAAATALARAADILAASAAFAAIEHVALPDCVSYSPAMGAVITAAWRSRSAQQNRADREFSRAAASIAALAAPRQSPVVPTKWTGRAQDGGIVDDGLTPILIKPGSSRTTQRIPAAALAAGAAAPARPLRLSASAVAGPLLRAISRKR